MGQAALEGRPGIIKVEKGWQSFREVNRVLYEPTKVNVEKMVEWLEEAATYQGTLENSMTDKGDGS